MNTTGNEWQKQLLNSKKPKMTEKSFIKTMRLFFMEFGGTKRPVKLCSLFRNIHTRINVKNRRLNSLFKNQESDPKIVLGIL